MESIIFALAFFAVVGVVCFVVYAIEHSPTARRGKYSCYTPTADGKVCVNPISAERAHAGRACAACESMKGSSED